MRRIILAQTCPPLAALAPALTGRVFAIAGPAWTVPEGVPVVALDDFLRAPSAHVREQGTMLVLGLSDLLTPANRVRVGQAILRPWPGLERVVVDRALFVAEPWRAWWAFRAVKAPYEDYADSYIAETRWKAAEERQTGDPFALAELVRWGQGVIAAPDPLRFGPWIEEIVEVSEGVRAEYEELKATAFEEETTLAGLLRRLGGFAEEVEPRRSIPKPVDLFKRRRSLVPEAVRVVRTDLPVDTFLTSRLRKVYDITQGIGEHFSAFPVTGEAP